MLSERNSFLIHQEKTTTEIYREDTLKELIDGLIAKLQALKKEDITKRKEMDIERILFFIYDSIDNLKLN